VYSQAHLNKVARQLNERPRKTLGICNPSRNLLTNFGVTIPLPAFKCTVRSLGSARGRDYAPLIMPVDYMLAVMRDPAADHKRRDAMAMAAAPYLHPKLSAIDAKLSSAAEEPLPERPAINIRFVLPDRDQSRDDQE
jgi:predicted pyridoxine 5'-phosphate oxidase superfamily flavin-nucleotide-binding protein